MRKCALFQIKSHRLVRSAPWQNNNTCTYTSAHKDTQALEASGAKDVKART